MGTPPYGGGGFGGSGSGPYPTTPLGSTLEKEDNADRNPSLFIGDRERVFFQRVATEVMECVTQQKIRYFAIEENLTQADNLYGESTQKFFRQPLEVYALILYNEPTIETGTFSSETRYSLKLYIQKFRVEQDLKMTPRQGDFVEFNNHYFEITKVYEPQLIAGLDTAGFKMGVYVECVSTRADVFSPHKTTPYDPKTNPDVIR